MHEWDLDTRLDATGSQSPDQTWTNPFASDDTIAYDSSNDLTQATANQDRPSPRAKLTAHDGTDSNPNEWASISSTDSEAALAAGARYQPIGELGQGGMGTVLLARQLGLEREVAVKVVRPDRQSEMIQRRFQHETKVSGSLEHPAIVPVHDAGDDYLVMKRLTGVTLRHAIEHDKVPLTTAVEALVQVADALAYSHQHGVIHRDIKPDNIMLGEYGDVVLVDWGLACRLDGPPLTPADVTVGTPAYLPPEAARGQAEQVGPASDVFQLGAVLFHLLSGTPPYRGSSVYAVLDAAAEAQPSHLVADPQLRPARLVALQRQAMHLEADQRCDLAAFRQGLRAWLRSTDGEQQAADLTHTFDRELSQIRTRDPADQYRAYHRLLERVDQVAVFDPLTDHQPLLDQIYVAYAAIACERTDLILAQELVSRIADPTQSQYAQTQLDLARRARRRSQRVTLTAKALTITGLIAGGLITCVVAWLAVNQAERHRHEREREAAALLADRQTHLSDDDSTARLAQLQELQRIGLRASGLDPNSLTARHVVGEATRGLIDLAIESNSWDLAQHQVELLRELGPTWRTTAHDLQLRLEQARTARQRARATTIAERRALITGIINQHHAVQATATNNWQQRMVEQIAAWDGPETGELLRPLLDSDDPHVLRLACAIYAVRPDIDANGKLLDMLGNERLFISDPALGALVARRQTDQLGAIIGALMSQPKRVDTWLRASGLARWSDEILAAHLQQLADPLMAARTAWWCGRPSWHRDRLVTLGLEQVPTQDLHDLARSARYRLNDNALVEQVCRALLTRNPNDWPAIWIMADQDDANAQLATVYAQRTNLSGDALVWLAVLEADALTRLDQPDKARAVLTQHNLPRHYLNADHHPDLSLVGGCLASLLERLDQPQHVKQVTGQAFLQQPGIEPGAQPHIGDDPMTVVEHSRRLNSLAPQLPGILERTLVNLTVIDPQLARRHAVHSMASYPQSIDRTNAALALALSEADPNRRSAWLQQALTDRHIDHRISTALMAIGQWQHLLEHHAEHHRIENVNRYFQIALAGGYLDHAADMLPLLSPHQRLDLLPQLAAADPRLVHLDWPFMTPDDQAAFLWTRSCRLLLSDPTRARVAWEAARRLRPSDQALSAFGTVITSIAAADRDELAAIAHTYLHTHLDHSSYPPDVLSALVSWQHPTSASGAWPPLPLGWQMLPAPVAIPADHAAVNTLITGRHGLEPAPALLWQQWLDSLALDPALAPEPPTADPVDRAAPKWPALSQQRFALLHETRGEPVP